MTTKVTAVNRSRVEVQQHCDGHLHCVGDLTFLPFFES